MMWNWQAGARQSLSQAPADACTLMSILPWGSAIAEDTVEDGSD